MAILETLIFGIFGGFWVLIVLLYLMMFIRIVFEYERGVLFTLGKYSKIMGPGVNFIIPFVQTYRKVDIRIKTVDIPKQEVMTADNVPVRVNAVVYFKNFRSTESNS